MGIVKSVQQISITIPAGSTSATQTITHVSTGNAFVEWGGSNCQVGPGAPDTYIGNIILTNSTTVTAFINTSDPSNTVTIYGTVKEFVPGIIKSVQQSSVVMSGTNVATQAISSVVTGNSAVVYNGMLQNSPSNDFAVNVWSSLTLTNSTTVTANKPGVANVVTVYFTVIEFNSGILNSSTQQFSITLSTSQLTNTQAISGVTAGNAMLIYGGQQLTNTNATWPAWCADCPWMQITNGTTITATRTAENGTNAIINGTVIEFKPGVVKSVNRGSITIGASANSNTQSITSVNTKYAGVSYQGWTASGGATTQDNVYLCAVVLTNATTITAQTNTNNATYTRTVGYEAMEFYPPSAGNMLLALMGIS